MNDITLYDLEGRNGRRFSPFCWRVKLALQHKDLDYTVKPVRFTEIPAVHDGAFKSVPIINHQGHWMDQSWAIVNYLETQFDDRPSLFGSPTGKSLAEFVTCWTDSQLLAPVFRAIVTDIYANIQPEDQPYFRTTREKRLGMALEDTLPQRDANRSEFRQKLYPLRQLLGSQPYLGGGQASHADYAVFSTFLWAETASDFALLEDDDPVQDWKRRMYRDHDVSGSY